MESERKPTTATKVVIDLQRGDVLIGRRGGRSVVEDASDKAGQLGFMRVETEHGQLYLEMQTQVQILSMPEKL